jgi:PAS domain S-box-containing protein
MNPNRDRVPTRSAALKIASVYAFVGALWILWSGWLLHHFVYDRVLAAELENVKGWFYVLVTAMLLGWWLDRYFSQIRGATELLQKSETRFATIFKDSPIAIAISRLRDGVFVDVNEVFTQLHGYSREEIIGSTSEQLRLWHSGNREQVIAELREKGSVVFSMQACCKNGDLRDLSASLQLIDLDGEPCILGTLVDITERKKAEDALRESEERLRFALESCSIGTWDLDLADHTACHSLEHGRIFGYNDPHSAWSRNLFLQHVLPEDRALVEEKNRYAIDNHSTLSYECRIRQVDGQIRWIWAAGRYRENASGKNQHLAGIVQDITERKRAEAALRESEERLQLFIDHAPAALAMFDREMHYLAVSQRWIADYSLEGREILGCSHYEIFPEIGDDLKQIHQRGLAGETVRGDDYRFERADGSIQYARWEMHPWRDSVGAIGGIVIFTEDITERMRAVMALRESEERFRSLIEAAPEAVFVQCADTFRYVNQAMVKLMKAERAEELLGKPFLESIAPEFHEVIRARIQSQRETGIPAPPMEQEFLCLDGTLVPVETTAVSIRFEGEEGHLVFVRDITRRRKAEKERTNLEVQLQQAQKMESVGRLAGGVAHDFNNLLMGIMGYTELCQHVLGRESPASAYLDEILDAAERSAGITRQLLAFARKQAIAPVLIDLNEHVEATLKLLRRLLGEEIDLAWMPRTQDARVNMDPSQLDQILANLAVNARDAIAGVGKLTVETGNVTFDAAYCAEHEGATPGDYVMLAVSDSGCGMDQETLDHIFEPFFTTKPVGKGTGLGLATIYGIVKQNDGYIDVRSEPGDGTTFRIYLPHYDQDSGGVKGDAGSHELPGGSETILLVEDEQSVRSATGLLLQSFGYNVLSAATPEEALRLAADHPGAIHLLITDVIMPGMNGRDLATKLSEMQPGLLCLYVSGYTADVIAHHGILEEGIHFLPKPFAREALANKVHEVLRGRRGTEKH